jgi:hypothetical protein
MMPTYVLRANRDLRDYAYRTEERYWEERRRDKAELGRPPIFFSFATLLIWSLGWLYRGAILFVVPYHDEDRSR